MMVDNNVNDQQQSRSRLTVTIEEESSVRPKQSTGGQDVILFHIVARVLFGNRPARRDKVVVKLNGSLQSKREGQNQPVVMKETPNDQGLVVFDISHLRASFEETVIVSVEVEGGRNSDRRLVYIDDNLWIHDTGCTKLELEVSPIDGNKNVTIQVRPLGRMNGKEIALAKKPVRIIWSGNSTSETTDRDGVVVKTILIDTTIVPFIVTAFCDGQKSNYTVIEKPKEKVKRRPFRIQFAKPTEGAEEHCLPMAVLDECGDPIPFSNILVTELGKRVEIINTESTGRVNHDFIVEDRVRCLRFSCDGVECPCNLPGPCYRGEFCDAPRWPGDDAETWEYWAYWFKLGVSGKKERERPETEPVPVVVVDEVVDDKITKVARTQQAIRVTTARWRQGVRNRTRQGNLLVARSAFLPGRLIYHVFGTNNKRWLVFALISLFLAVRVWQAPTGESILVSAGHKDAAALSAEIHDSPFRTDYERWSNYFAGNGLVTDEELSKEQVKIPETHSEESALATKASQAPPSWDVFRYRGWLFILSLVWLAIYTRTAVGDELDQLKITYQNHREEKLHKREEAARQAQAQANTKSQDKDKEATTVVIPPEPSIWSKLPTNASFPLLVLGGLFVGLEILEDWQMFKRRHDRHEERIEATNQ